MIRYRDNDWDDTRNFRAQHFCDAASRLESKAAELLKEAAEFRRLATQLNPTSGSPHS